MKLQLLFLFVFFFFVHSLPLYGQSSERFLDTIEEENVSQMVYTIKGRVIYDVNNNCLADSDDLPAGGWFVRAQNDLISILITDNQGYFELNTTSPQTIIQLLFQDPEAEWVVCEQNLTVNTDMAQALYQPVFLVKSVNGGCPMVNVSITQPDLQRCSTSNFVITVRNQGLVASEPLILDLKLPPELALVSASEVYIQQGQNLEFSLPAIERLESRNVDVSVTLSCLTQLGSTQTVVAQLRPSLCQSPISGPFYTVEGHCEGNNLQFFMENIGEGGVPNPTNYHVLADGLEVAGWQEITLAEGATPYLLEIPADGRTWRVELQQSPNYEAESTPSATVEGCGVGINNLYSVDVKNGWRFDEKSPMIGTFQASNTTGSPNKIEEAARGFGFYNYIDDTDWLEYTARFQVPENIIVNEATFLLHFSSTYKITSFQSLATNGYISSMVLGPDNNLSITVSGFNVQPGKYVMLRFRIKPDIQNSASGYNTLMVVEGDIVINGGERYTLASGFHNYNTVFPLFDNSNYSYPDEILTYGGRGIEFGTCIGQAGDGSIYYGGESRSFSYRGRRGGLLIKATPAGEAIWLNVVKIDEQTNCNIQGVVGLADGGCIITGTYWPAGTNGYLNECSVFFARVDGTGHIVWQKSTRPGGDENGAKATGVISTDDGHCVIFGFSQSSNSTIEYDVFYIKVDIEQGNTIWNKYQNLSGQAFIPYKAVKSSDDNLVFVGPNEGDLANYELYLQKVNALSGAILWQTGKNIQQGLSLGGLAVSNNGDIIVAGYSDSGLISGEYVEAPVFIRYTADGTYVNEKRPLLGPFNIASCNNIITAPDGGFYGLGKILVDTIDHVYDAMLLKIDNDSEVQWLRSYGNGNSEDATEAIISSSNQLLIGGYSQGRAPFYDLQSLLIRTDLDGNLLVDAPHGPILAQHRIHIFPNPAVDKIWLRCDDLNEPLPWIITDATGRLINQGTLQETLSAVALGDLPAGIYYLLFPDGTYRSEKIVIKQCR